MNCRVPVSPRILAAAMLAVLPAGLAADEPITPDGSSSVTQMPGQIPQSHPSQFSNEMSSLVKVGHSVVYESAKEVKPLAVGEMVPVAAIIKQADGEAITLGEALGGKKSVVIFYRGGWCPYCNAHLAELAKIQPQLTAGGVQLLALSPDSPETSAKHAEERPLPYRLLSDNKHEAMKAFGIAFRMDDATVERYKGYGIDLSAASGNEDKVLPVPAVFVVNEEGIIEYAHANADYTVRMKGEEILAAAGVEVTGAE